jgi:hypothetical protein
MEGFLFALMDVRTTPDDLEAGEDPDAEQAVSIDLTSQRFQIGPHLPGAREKRVIWV